MDHLGAGPDLDQTGGGGTGGSAEPPGIPWEQRDRLGWPDALLRTVKLSLFSPSEFFARLPPDGPTPPPPLGPVGSPLLYAVLVGVPSTVIGMVWQLIASSFGILAGDASEAVFSLTTAVIAASLSPILIPVLIVITSLVFHLFLLILGGAQNGLLATLRAVSYASGPALFQVIPLCGSLVSGIWGFVITVIGLQVVHRTTMGRAFGAVALPIVCCCGFTLLTLLALGVAAGLLTGLLDWAR